MKGIKGRFLKRFRSIPSAYTSKQHALVLRTEYHQKLSDDGNLQSLPSSLEQEDRTNSSLDLGEEELDSNICLRVKNGHIISNHLVPTKKIDVCEECEYEFNDSMPEMESSSSSSSSPGSPHNKVSKEIPKEVAKDLSEFEEKCPPGGSDKVILYTTSLRGIRKTFDDCHNIKFLLDSFHVVYFERDVSMHLAFRNELWEILGDRIVPPRLFIKGRHIGGADEVVALNERGILKNLLRGIPLLTFGSNLKCDWCGGVRFMLCSECNGSRKIFRGDQQNGGKLFGRCPKCNENGLVKCPTCSN